MSINATCRFCHGPAFLTRSLFIHPYSPEEIELIKQIDKKKLDELRKAHDNWLEACYKCLAEKCPKDDQGVAPRNDPTGISLFEP